jgi:hypothetical protein
MTDPLFNQKTSLPYAGTTGSRAVGASADRARIEAADGTAAYKQNKILQLLAQAGPSGMTCAELEADRYGLGHHGQVSSQLSALHKDNRVASLMWVKRPDTAKGSHVYVLPEFVLGRIERPHGSTTRKAPERSAAALTEQDRSLLTSATASLARYGRASTMPVRTENFAALLALVERLAK